MPAEPDDAGACTRAPCTCSSSSGRRAGDRHRRPCGASRRREPRYGRARRRRRARGAHGVVRVVRARSRGPRRHGRDRTRRAARAGVSRSRSVSPARSRRERNGAGAAGRRASSDRAVAACRRPAEDRAGARRPSDSSTPDALRRRDGNEPRGVGESSRGRHPRGLRADRAPSPLRAVSSSGVRAKLPAEGRLGARDRRARVDRSDHRRMRRSRSPRDAARRALCERRGRCPRSRRRRAVAARVAWRPLRALSFEIIAGARVPLIRNELFFEPLTLVYEAPFVVPFVGTAVLAHLP